MLRNATGLTLCLVFLVLPASAQITLTEDDIVPEYGTINSTTYNAQNPTNLQAIVNATGGNQTYDFTVYTYDAGNNTVEEVVPMTSDIPLASDPAYADADFVLVVGPDQNPGENATVYVFISIENGAYLFHGSVAIGDLNNDGNEDTSTFKNTPPQQLFQTPMTFATTWTSTTTQSASTLGIEATADVTMTSEVDGWGTLITPSGQADCLRIMTTTTVTVMGITTTTRTLEFITEDGLGASVVFDAQDVPNTAIYSVTSQDDNGGGDPTALETLDTDLPEAFELGANYPNPFNPETVIPFDLSESGHVTLSVFDALGREVTTLVNETLPAGSYTADFRAEQVPSGVYFYKLQVDGTLLSRAMILQK